MGRVWVTSDLHIGHDRDFLYGNRGFDNIIDHDQALIDNWNSLVAEEDVVYVLGDIMLRHKVGEMDFNYGLNILSQLKGNLVLLRGNHDSESKIELYRTCPNVIQAGLPALYLKYPEEGGYNFYLSHYPTLTSHEQLKQMKSALINLFGHTHQKERFYNNHPFMYCCCLDAHDMKPVLLDEVIEEIRRKRSAYKNIMEAERNKMDSENTVSE